MQITLYQSTAEPNRLDKTPYLDQVHLDLVGSVRGELNVMSPVIDIEKSGTLSGYNYVYISELTRYYYITDYEVIRNGIIRLHLDIDVLMSFRSYIENCSGLVSRNEGLYDTMLIDDRLRFLGYKSINTIKFPSGVKRGESFILAVNGN